MRELKKIHNKLVRDNIPKIIEVDNKICKVKTLSDEQYKYELKKKLCEESIEVLQADTTKQLTEEIADVMELVEALIKAYDISLDDVNSIKNKKLLKNGAFDNKVFLEYVIGD